MTIYLVKYLLIYSLISIVLSGLLRPIQSRPNQRPHYLSNIIEVDEDDYA